MKLRIALVGCLLFFMWTSAWAERKRDPLTPLEIDQLRDTAVEPALRLKLLIEFTRVRLDALEQVRINPKMANRGQEVHDRLQDFLDIYDELNDNIDMYADRKDDIRKPLKAIIEADTEFQAKIRALKDTATTTAAESRAYEFLLQSALETLDSSAQDHRQLLTEQEVAARHKKREKNARSQSHDR